MDERKLSVALDTVLALAEMAPGAEPGTANYAAIKAVENAIKALPKLLMGLRTARAALPDAWAAVQCGIPREVIAGIDEAIAMADVGPVDRPSCLITALEVAGTEVEVSADLYEQFFEMLPPVAMPFYCEGVRYDFGYAEGQDPVIGFRKTADGQFRARLSDITNPRA